MNLNLKEEEENESMKLEEEEEAMGSEFLEMTRSSSTPMSGSSFLSRSAQLLPGKVPLASVASKLIQQSPKYTKFGGGNKGLTSSQEKLLQDISDEKVDTTPVIVRKPGKALRNASFPPRLNRTSTAPPVVQRCSKNNPDPSLVDCPPDHSQKLPPFPKLPRFDSCGSVSPYSVAHPTEMDVRQECVVTSTGDTTREHSKEFCGPGDEEDEQVAFSTLHSSQGAQWVVFINVNSGGKQGERLMVQMKQYIPSSQVFDLISDQGPAKGLAFWEKNNDKRILVCGGDGTVGWVLSGLDAVKADNHSALIGVVPLGTGNDLSRNFRWGSSYVGEPVPSILHRMEYSTVAAALDRWKIEVNPNEPDADSHDFIMNNYISLGVDAEIVLGFHELRERKKDLFQSVLINKGWYAGFSAKAALKHWGEDALRNNIELIVDGETIQFSRKVQGIVVMNLLTYGGNYCWGKTEQEKFRKPCFSDGVLEVVGIKGVAHLGGITTGIADGLRIAQGKQIQINISAELAAQVDGEPWVCIPGKIQISFWNQMHLLFNTDEKTKVTKKSAKPSPFTFFEKLTALS